MNYKKSYALMWILYLTGVILLAPPLLAGAGKGWMAAAYFRAVFFLNCPHCGAFIW